MENRHIFAEDYRPERSWELLAWCQASGADAFSISFVGTDAASPLASDPLWRALQPFGKGRVNVQVLAHFPGGDGPLPTREVWALTPETLALLREHLSGGLFMSPANAQAVWLEDPLFYRGGELMLGIVSHEGEGVLLLTSLEAAELAAAGFPTRDRAGWL